MAVEVLVAPEGLLVVPDRQKVQYMAMSDLPMMMRWQS